MRRGNLISTRRIFDRETVQDWELGAKTSWLDRKLTANLTFYRMDISGYQDRAFDGVSFTVLNAGKLRQQGFEFDGVAKPIRGLSLFGSVAYLDSSFLNYPNAPGLPGCAPNAAGVVPAVCTAAGLGGTQDLEGKPAANSPKWSGRLGFDWAGDVGTGGLTYNLTSNLSFFSKQYEGIITDANPQTIEDAYAVLGARASLNGPDDRWTVSVFGNNLLDKQYGLANLYQPLDASLGLRNGVFPGSTAVRRQHADPRTYGLSANVPLLNLREGKQEPRRQMAPGLFFYLWDRQTQPNLIAVSAIPAMKMVSSTINMAGRQPADAMSLIRVFIPSAAIAATRQKRESRLPPSRTQVGHGKDAVGDDEKRKGRGEPRQDRRAVLRLRVEAPRCCGDRDDHGQEHRDARKLDDGRRVARLGRDRVARADHLRDIVDRRADEDTCMRVVETGIAGNHRVEQHGDGGEDRNADHREQGRIFLSGMAREGGRNGHRGRCSADRRGSARQNSETRIEPHPASGEGRRSDRQRNSADDQQKRAPAERHHFGHRDLQAQKRNPEAEHELGREGDARVAAVDIAEEVHGKPDQEREQHDRPAGMAGDQTGRAGDHDGRDEPRGNAVKRRPALHSDRLHAVSAAPISAEVLRAAIRKIPAAARLAKGSHCIAPRRPIRSASHPVRIGPGASPNALFARVSTAKAVP